MDDSVAVLNSRFGRVSPPSLAARLERTGGPHDLDMLVQSLRASFLRLEGLCPFEVGRDNTQIDRSCQD